MYQTDWKIEVLESFLDGLAFIFSLLYVVTRPIFILVSAVARGVYAHFIRLLSLAVFLAILGLLAQYIR